MSAEVAATLAFIANSTYSSQWMKLIKDYDMLQDTVLPTIDRHWFEFPPTEMLAHASLAVFVAAVATASTLGNALVVFVFLYSSHLRAGGIYTVNLALSDVLSPLLSYYLFTGTSFKQIWVYGRTVCVYYGFTQGFFGLMSIVTLAVISAERCFVIMKPFRARDITSVHRIGITIFIWVYCAMVGGPPILGWSKYAPAGFLTSCCFDYTGRHWEARSFVMYLFTLGFVIPVSVIVYSYVQIFKVVYKSEKGANISGSKHAGAQQSTKKPNPKHQESEQNGLKAIAPSGAGDQNGTTERAKEPKAPKLKKQVRKDIQMAKVMLIVILTFVFAWTPYAAVAVLGQFGPEGILTPFAAMAPAIFAKTSTLYNPIIYAYKDAKFRSAMRSTFPWISKVMTMRRDVDGSMSDSEASQNSFRSKVSKSIQLKGKRMKRRITSLKNAIPAEDKDTINSTTTNI